MTAPPPAPRAATELRVFRSALGTHLFVADGSRVYDVDEDTAAELEAWIADGRVGLDAVDAALGERLITRRAIDGTPLPPLPVSSISLNLAQGCNMACGYCYADEGRFGGAARMMSEQVAQATVEQLLLGSDLGVRVVVGFMGGEPLLNRRVLHAIVPWAEARAEALGRRIAFSITTNATLITEDDARLFRDHPFSVQVSMDGDRAQHDAARPMRDGGGSYDATLAGVRLMQRVGKPRQLTCRVTVTRRTRDLPGLLDHLIGLGFDEVGFALTLVSPNPGLALEAQDFDPLLEGMIACGRRTLAELLAGRSYPFGNFETAMQEIHRGSHRPYPCGAGAAYLSANAEGRLYACHRLIDDPAFAMGDVASGPDDDARRAHLERRHVDRAEPCKSCWARYLCGGGCYHEVERRGRPGCDLIRAWLSFCLGAYAELSARRPLPVPSDPISTSDPAAVAR